MRSERKAVGGLSATTSAGARRGARRPRPRTRLVPSLLACLALCLCAQAARAQARRLVVVKVDGLPAAAVDKYVRERDPRTGKSRLPWIEHVFYERGARLANFYVRGMSLSGPSWSLLDTGQHLQIKGNVEFDRLTLHSYDYLNFIPFWLGHAGRVRVDMPGAEVLDELGIPLLYDSYPYDERHLSFQLYQRGTRWTTLERGLKNRFTSRAPRELFGEWLTGFEARSIVMEQLERELLGKLRDPRIRYLDFYTTDFDHAAHHNHDRESHLGALREFDGTIGRIWTAIRQSPLAAETVLVVVSDHGTNSLEGVYSQGYNLVKLLASAEGGGHHVVTKRRLLNDYAIKGFYPLVPLIYTTSQESFYLKGQSTDYPTALVDFDGNERATIHLRDSDLNILHILLQQLRRKDLPAAERRAATDAFFQTIERRRAGWQKLLDELREELAALRRRIERQRAVWEAQPKKWTKEDMDAGRDQDARRVFAQLDSWQGDEREYGEYARTLANLLSLRPETFAPAKLVVPELIAKGAMGGQNTIHQLQNYVAGLAPGGVVLDGRGALDWQKSFVRVDYLRLLRGVTVRNNVQAGVANRPVDFLALRVPPGALPDEATRGDLRADEIIWLYGGEESQALLLGREGRDGQLYLRYVPVAGLRQDAEGKVAFERAQWRDGLPLKIWEDEKAGVPAGVSRAAWLSSWHTDLEWLRALHETHYSNAVVGLHEQLARHTAPALEADAPGLDRDEQLMRRFRRRQRQLVETDLLILASDHWNFDVRGFNPGGNHGSFFRVSTHSTLMLAGVDATRVPRGLVVQEPYDSLSFVPTMLALTGRSPAAGQHVQVKLAPPPRRYPGRVISEIFAHPAGPSASSPASPGAAPSATSGVKN